MTFYCIPRVVQSATAIAQLLEGTKNCKGLSCFWKDNTT
jgi:hypothetical protein